MEKKYLDQRFTYTELIPYKDYSKVSDKPKNLGLNSFDIEKTVTEVEEENFGSFESIKFSNAENKDVTIRLESYHEFKNEKRKRTKFFYGDELVDERIPVTPFFKKGRIYITNKDKQIKRHYNRPFSSISIHILERTVTLRGDIVNIRVNKYVKSRYFNCIYFKKTFTTRGLSFNFKTGNFTTYEITKKKKEFQTNNFYQLYAFSNFCFERFKKELDSKLTPEAYNEQIFNSKSLIDIKNEANLNLDEYDFNFAVFTMFRDAGLEMSFNVRHDFYIDMLKNYVKVNNIKIPNKFQYYLTNWYPGKNFLKKNDNKLIQSILDKLMLKSKTINKILHEKEYFDLTIIFELMKFFGQKELSKYLSNLNPRIFDISVTSTNHYLPQEPNPNNLYNGLLKKNDQILYHLNDKEKNTVLKLLNSFCVEFEGTPEQFKSKFKNVLHDFDDHILMIGTLIEIFPHVGFNATTWTKFQLEHAEYSKLRAAIRRGYTIELLYDEEITKIIEEPIYSHDDVYYPIILKNDFDYNFEGKHMHHCVGGYIDYSTSMIISVRQSTPDSDERVTCEYESVNKLVRQARYFNNGAPPAHFIQPLENLKSRISRINGPITYKEKIKKPFSKEKLKEMANATIGV